MNTPLQVFWYGLRITRVGPYQLQVEGLKPGRTYYVTGWRPLRDIDACTLARVLNQARVTEPRGRCGEFRLATERAGLGYFETEAHAKARVAPRRPPKAGESAQRRGVFA